MSPISSPPATRRSERKRTANTRAADLSSPVPHRPKASKKRKASTALPPRRRPRQKSPEEEAADTEEEDQSAGTAEADEDIDDKQEPVDLLLPYLTVSDYPVAVASEHSNQVNARKYGAANINAFAKICGSEWTYYVLETHVYFGRSPEPQARQSTGPGADSTQENADDQPPIAIDLGPSKVVSRTHGELKYSHTDDAWHVHCYGRNGIRVNDRSLKRGESTPINSGTVIAIAGTEMVFIAAKGKPEVHQIFIDRILAHQNNEGIDEELGSRHPQPAPDGPQPAPQNGYHTYSGYPPPPDPYHDGRPPIAPAPANMARPVTPDPSPPKRPSTASAKKRSPGYKRGIMMESTEQIDYSVDSSKDLKPGCSYATLITWAILSTAEESLSLSGIYMWIKARYAYYRLTSSGWQNSIRHNLSLSQAFEKVARRPDEPGKGMKWRIVPEHREATIAAARKNASKAGGWISSTPDSPAGHASSSGFLPIANGHLKSSPNARTPPLSSYPPLQQPSFTPTRGPQMPYPAYAPTQGTHPVLSDETSPMPTRRTNGHLTAMDSSPTLTSGAWAHDQPIQTPAPRPYNLTVPAPNTAKLPTSHMPDSSPAPFWKFPGSGINSTPANSWPALSPEKNGDANDRTLGVQSSSPPPATNGVDSPTRRSGPKHSFTSSQSVNGNGLGPGEDEDGGIDITKGFTNISSYHRQRSNVGTNAVNS